MEAINTQNLSKVYQNGVKALDEVNFSIKEGELFTVLGPNGAGKTTLLRTISTQLLPTSGEARVLGYDVVSEASEIREHIAIVPQDVVAYGMYTPWDYAYYFALLRRIPRREVKKIAEKALRTVGLWNMRKQKCAELSGGERRRAIIASALSSYADVLLLDEPTRGLDVVAKRRVWSALRELAKKGQTIILTTHDMEEAEFISDRLAIMNNGQIKFQGNLGDAKRLFRERYRVVFSGELQSGMLERGLSYSRIGDKCIVYVSDEEEAAVILKEALKSGMQAYVSPVTLEDVFVRLLGDVNEEDY